MSEQIIDATFDGAVFRPDGPVPLAPATRVRITVTPPVPSADSQPAVGIPAAGDDDPQPGEPYSFLRFASRLQLDGPADASVRRDGVTDAED